MRMRVFLSSLPVDAVGQTLQTLPLVGAACMKVDPGLWYEINPAPPTGRGALFLDRDGVIVTDTHYLHRVEDVQVIEGAATSIACCNALGIRIVVVTNQASIGRGYYGWDDFHAVQGASFAELAASFGTKPKTYCRESSSAIGGL